MNARDILSYGDRTVRDTLDGVPPEEWETPGVCGYWSVKNIIAHLASYERVLVDVLSSQVRSSQTPALDELFEQGEDFNDLQVNQRAALTPDKTLAEYSEAHVRTIELVACLTPELLQKSGTLPWYGDEYSIDDYIVYGYYGHKREHMAQVAVFKDVLSTRTSAAQ